MSGKIDVEIRNANEFIDLARKLPRNENINDFIILFETMRLACFGCRASRIAQMQDELEQRYRRCATAETAAIGHFAKAQNQNIKLFFDGELFFQTQNFTNTK